MGSLYVMVGNSDFAAQAHSLCGMFSRSEAAALLGMEGLTAEQAALALGPLCDMAIVTDGANGSCISALGTLHVRLRAQLRSWIAEDRAGTDFISRGV